MIRTTKVTGRRTLRFGRMEDILRDVESLNRQVENSGATLRALGNWTPAQVVDHVTKAIALSLDGYPPGLKAPLLIRLILKMKKSSILNRPTRPGVRLPGRLAALFAPDPDVTWGQAVTRMRHVIERLRRGERMNAVSPAFGPLVHEEWTQLHCRHAELHLSFVHAG